MPSDLARPHAGVRQAPRWSISARSRRLGVILFLVPAFISLSPISPSPIGQVVSAAGGPTTRVSVGPAGLEGDGPSEAPHLSGDGRFIAFASFATNLAPQGATLGGGDIFLKDRVLDTLTLVSVPVVGAASDGFSYYPMVSDNGRYVVFQSTSTNLVVGDTNGKKDVEPYWV